MSTPTAPVKARGLEGVVALDTELSFIDGQAGELVYRGYDIRELAGSVSFEETLYLLWKGELPNKSQLDELNKQIRAERSVPAELIEHLKNHTPKDANAMAVLQATVAMLGTYDEDIDNSPVDLDSSTRQSIRLIAKIPTILAAFARIRQGKDVVAPKGEGSTAFEFLRMLNGEAPGEKAEEIMDICLVLHAEHGLNASTFTGRVIGATLSDVYSSVAGAIGALKGPLHGGANIKVMQMLKDIDASGQSTLEYVTEKLEKKERLMGFGHRVYKTIDPRAVILRDLLKGLSEEKGEMKWYDMSNTLMDTVVKEKGINPNVDFFSASVYHLVGIETDLFTPIFAMSRTAGWTAHLLEQWSDNRLIRPRAEYVGPKGKKVTPIADRG